MLQDLQAWVKECVPPLPICTFMPNRLRDQNANTVNQTNFRSLSRILFENQAVCRSFFFFFFLFLVLSFSNLGCRCALGNKFISWCWDNYLSCVELQCDPSWGAFLRQRFSEFRCGKRFIPEFTCIIAGHYAVFGAGGSVSAPYGDGSSLRFSSPSSSQL